MSDSFDWMLPDGATIEAGPKVTHTWAFDEPFGTLRTHSRTIEHPDGSCRVDVGEAARVTITEAGAAWERLDRILASVEANERLIADSRRKRKRWEATLRSTRRALRHTRRMIFR